MPASLCGAPSHACLAAQAWCAAQDAWPGGLSCRRQTANVLTVDVHACCLRRTQGRPSTPTQALLQGLLGIDDLRVALNDR